MKSSNKRVLVLNADYTPISVTDWKKAIVLDFKGIAKVVDFYKDDHIICTGGTKWPVPAVIVLNKYKSYKRRDIPFSRKNVFLRDDLTCQYCGVTLPPHKLTFDHVIPKSIWYKKNGRGRNKTATKWDNIVTCCHPCNRKKADKPLEKSGLKLISQPKKPNPYDFILGITPWSNIPDEWILYLPNKYKR